MINISEASEEDLDQIIVLQKKAFHGQTLIYNNITLPAFTQTLGDLKEEFKIKSIYKVEVEGEIIASVRCNIKDNTLYIDKLIVDPDLQNQGIGTKVMHEIEKRYSTVINRYQVSTGHKSTRNLHLYKKLGYREIRQEQLNDSCNLIVMEKRVD